MILTYRYRIKNLAGELERQARAVNFVWNFCNESQRSCLRLGKKWLTGFDLNNLTAATSKDMGLPATTIQAIGQQYAASRSQKKRPYLRWRGKKSLGWIPVKSGNIRQVNDGFKFNGKVYRVFLSRPLPDGARIRDGSSFAQDARGRWHLNLVVEVPEARPRPVRKSVGVDLGLKDFAVLSTGEKIAAPRHFREIEERLGKAQRARKKRLARSLHEKAKNARRDFQHKLSTRLVREFDFIAVGDASPARLARTSMAKSVHDAGWFSFRSMLRYKAIRHGARYAEVNEAFSTQICSRCGCLPDGRPKGIAGLGIRRWRCDDCGAVHDRDQNAALNIVRSGHRALAEGARA